MPPERGTTASGPLSPINASVGESTIPPFANLGILGISGGSISIPKKLKPKPAFRSLIKPFNLSITLLNTNLIPSNTTPADVFKTVELVSKNPVPKDFSFGINNLISDKYLYILSEILV